MLWLSFPFLKLFSFTQISGTHSTRRGKSNHQRNRLLGLDSQREKASAFEGFQGSARMWWVGTAFAVHRLPNINFRKVVCGGPWCYLHHAVDVTESHACSDPAGVSPQPCAESLAQDPKAELWCWLSALCHTNWAFSSWFWSWPREDLQRWEWTHRHLTRCPPESYTTTSFFKNQEYCYNLTVWAEVSDRHINSPRAAACVLQWRRTGSGCCGLDWLLHASTESCRTAIKPC